MPQPRELINQCFGSWGSWWEEMLLNLGILTLICVFSCTCLYCFCGICLRCSQLAPKQATSMLIISLADCLGHISKQGCVCKIIRTNHQAWSVGDVSGEPEWWLTSELYQSIRGSSPHPCPWNARSAHFPHNRSHFKDASFREECAIKTIWTVSVTKPH